MMREHRRNTTGSAVKAISHRADPVWVGRACRIHTASKRINTAMVGIESVDGKIMMKRRHQRGPDVTEADNRNMCLTTR